MFFWVIYVLQVGFCWCFSLCNIRNLHTTIVNMLENTLQQVEYKGKHKGRNTKKKNIVQKKHTYFTILGTLYIVSFVIEVPRLASLTCILLCTLWQYAGISITYTTYFGRNCKKQPNKKKKHLYLSIVKKKKYSLHATFAYAVHSKLQIFSINVQQQHISHNRHNHSNHTQVNKTNTNNNKKTHTNKNISTKLIYVKKTYIRAYAKVIVHLLARALQYKQLRTTRAQIGYESHFHIIRTPNKQNKHTKIN